ncbi:MAG: transporter substrate-binding domain-containing protein [Acholeplasmataceae bacterium]
MKKFFVWSLLLASLSMLVACSSNEQFDLNTETKIVVGLEAAYAPFNWSTPSTNEFTLPLDGHPGVYVDGYDVVMAKMIADALDLELIIKMVDWDGLIPALLAGEIDLIVAGMSPTSERAQTVSFSGEYYRSEQVMVIRINGGYQDATSLNDFAGARVVAQLGTLQDDLIDQITNVNHLEPLDTYGMLATALSTQAADAFIAELPVAQGMVAANSELKIIQFEGTNGFTVSDEEVIVSIAMRQEDVNLLEAVNEALSAISDETRQTIMSAALNRQPNA